MTGRDLVTACLRLIGAVAPGESLEASEATDGLAALNSLLGSWSNKRLLIFTQTTEAAITLTPNDATYTLGAGGTITTRPQRIDGALIRDDSVSPAVDQPPMDLLTRDQYMRIAVKDVTSPCPTALYDDGGFPQRTVTLYPVPSAAKKLILYTLRPLTSIATLDTELSFPPGYERAIKYNGAIDLSPEYGKIPSQEVKDIAKEALADIKRANHIPLYLRCDPAVLGGGCFDIYSGGSR